MTQKTGSKMLPTLLVVAGVVALLFVVPWGNFVPGGKQKEKCQHGDSVTLQLIGQFAPTPRQNPVGMGVATNGGSMSFETATESPWKKQLPAKCGDRVEFLVRQPDGSGEWVRCRIEETGFEIVAQRSGGDHPDSAYCVYKVE